jgi:hypothetical protein
MRKSRGMSTAIAAMNVPVALAAIDAGMTYELPNLFCVSKM